jgi:hypothetical protein
MNAARFVAFAFVLLAAPPLRLADQQPRDASPLIASARQALGGDAALAAITSFSVTGTMTQHARPERQQLRGHQVRPAGSIPPSRAPDDGPPCRLIQRPWRLFLDARTHLPVRLSWMARPIVTLSTTSVASVNERTGAVASGRPPGFPAGDPTSGMPDVPWEMTISDYRVADGLTWPHRMTTTVGADKYEELRLGRFRLNPAIDAKVFAPRK